MAIWWRLQHGVSGVAALVFTVLGLLPTAVTPATHGAQNGDYVFWRDVVTGFAIGGYDTVAYFVDARPRLGIREYEYDWRGVTWLFVSAANRAVFVRDPKVYAPRYGGYGAHAVAQGVLARGSPVEWLIYEDRLFFFASASRRLKWREQGDTGRQTANINWPRINGALVRN